MVLHLKRIALLFLLLMISGSSLLWAAGGEDGIAICVANNVQYRPSMAATGGGTSIISWQDYRNGVSDIFVQKINAAGVAYWTSDGIATCTASGTQYYPVIASDGMGGGIVAWYDNRSGNNDIYAQHLNASGNPLWVQNGISVCSELSGQEYPQIAPDGSGGAIIVWRDNRSGNFDLYTQRIDANGNALWTAGGVPLCTAPNEQYLPDIIPYSGGAFLAWPDERDGELDIYAQKIDLNGNSLWAAGGVAVCTAAFKQNHVKIVSDGAGGAIVAWRDKRGGTTYDIYAQKVNAGGSTQWTADGVALCTEGNDQNRPGIIPDGAGGAIVAWEDYRSFDYNIYAQRINSSGNPQWLSGGITVCTAASSQYNPQVITDGAGGAIIGWEDYRSGNWDLFSQRIAANGAAQWVNNGVLVCNASGTQWEIRIASNGAGGATYTWTDEREGTTDPNIYTNNIGHDGMTGVPTAIKTYELSLEGSDVMIQWELSEAGIGMSFSVSRAEGSSREFMALPAPEIIQTGMTFSFADRSCLPGMSYRYRVEVSDEEGTKILFETGAITIPQTAIALFQNHPNPFNPSTMISFLLPEEARVTLSILNAEGKPVITLLNDILPAGVKEIVWNGTDESGNQVGSGVYFCRLMTGKNMLSRKMVLVK